jgi:hypothetical protein
VSLTSSFISDERGVTEPYTDLPALGLVVVGILLFSCLLCGAYSAYAAKACYADLKDDLRTMAVALTGDPTLACDGSAMVLDAHKLDNMSAGGDFLRKYGRPGDAVAIEIVAGNYHWTSEAIGKASAAYVLPVTVRLNDARCLAGTMKVSVAIFYRHRCV